MTTPTPTPVKKPRARRTPAERAQVRLTEARDRLTRANEASAVADAKLKDAQSAKKAADAEVVAAENAHTWASEHPDLPTNARRLSPGGAS